MISTLDRTQIRTTLPDLDRAVALARLAATPVLCTHVEPLARVPDPLDFLATSSRALGHGALWMHQQTDVAFAGAGAALRISTDGPDRFAAASRAMTRLRTTLCGHDRGLPFPLLGGFAFDTAAHRAPRWTPFPAGLLTVPEVLVQIQGGRAHLRVSVRVDQVADATQVAQRMRQLVDRANGWLAMPPRPATLPGITGRDSEPARADWEAAVSDAVAAIHAGSVAKVVLAREERLLADAELSPIATLGRLRAANPSATLFAIESGQSWFLSATPERLVRLDDGHVDVTCLAGSIGAGSALDERALLARQLLASHKDREEHEIVVRSTMDALRGICTDVERASGTPRIAATRSIQHLETPLTATFASGGTILDLVERLHPTPAVGGFPTTEALGIIRTLEAIDRGWYAGPVGWTDIDGSGEFAVAIRSALLSGISASLFAGCGIVAQSRPCAEFAETQLKLLPMLAALGAR